MIGIVMGADKHINPLAASNSLKHRSEWPFCPTAIYEH